MRRDRYGHITSSTEPSRDGVNNGAVVAFLLLLLAVLGILVWAARPLTEASPVSDSARKSAPASSVTPSAATYPAEILLAARTIATVFAPTPSPTATYAAMPTPRPLVCETEGRTGEVCKWARNTPTPTPGLPVCETPAPGMECIWQESR